MTKRNIVITCVVVVVLAAAAVYIAINGSSGNNTANNSTGNMNMSNQTGASNAKPTATNDVSIKDFAFSPADITVKKGTTVTWTNKDSATHTVTENDGQAGPDSGDLATGKTYSFTYGTVGTFKYHCSIHTGMIGTVTVTE